MASNLLTFSLLTFMYLLWNLQSMQVLYMLNPSKFSSSNFCTIWYMPRKFLCKVFADLINIQQLIFMATSTTDNERYQCVKQGRQITLIYNFHISKNLINMSVAAIKYNLLIATCSLNICYIQLRIYDHQSKPKPYTVVSNSVVNCLD